MKMRFAELKPLQEEMIDAMRKGDISKAKSIASKSDHPVFEELLYL